MNKEFWLNKKVFVTGHTGFKGSWLSLWLQKMGAHVTGFALAPPSNPNLFELAQIAETMQSLTGDIREYAAVKHAIHMEQPEIIFHMAAQSLVQTSYQNPIETYATNVMGTVHVLEAAKQTKSVKVIINVTSDKCYDNKDWLWAYREDEPMGGVDPYSNSKGCAELVTSAYRHSYLNGTNTAALASVRAGNVIGGGDWAANRLIPDIIKACIHKQPVLIRNPHSIRPWQHVLEPLAGYLLLAEKLWYNKADYAEAWNFGPYEQDMKEVSWIAEQLVTLWGDDASWKLNAAEHPHEAKLLKLDSSKARARLHWQPQWSLQQALNAIVKWYKAWIDGKNLREITYQQIDEYSTTNKRSY